MMGTTKRPMAEPEAISSAAPKGTPSAGALSLLPLAASMALVAKMNPTGAILVI